MKNKHQFFFLVWGVPNYDEGGEPCLGQNPKFSEKLDLKASLMCRFGQPLPYNVLCPRKPLDTTFAVVHPDFCIAQKVYVPQVGPLVDAILRRVDDCSPSMSYTHGSLWTRHLRWCTLILYFLHFQVVFLYF